ncbi:hypothetical protein MCAL160_0546 [Mycoplasmopsis californica HAZ160_1]|uniref:Conjugal transfer protein TraE n=2 Tax=Mycoplasmopsis californica TaxID=2113 RepID=A0A059XRP3_9BACT|nr:PrgI family protein [Mycoplasmopsis californica]AIA29473.1 conjugal transfer protein TraE [Mycoplasmopsis californica]BAP01081.1 hypothetical protein MCAL160_0546 [Mycoplasmopsis californica HAZ160_1]BBG40945.1 hypothetical protein MCAL106_0546 [Mycoplasmopsis californica]BBG41539.1 hypothetical protein MCAL106E_0546 [Mycoplasmopsis californica]BBG42132.1 hypothetical protein MCAL106L_0546 [Mycoplasmopsis californica]
MLQPKNIKKTKNKVFKNYTWLDFGILVAILMTSFFGSNILLPKSLNTLIKLVVWFASFAVLSIVLIKIPKYQVRLYILFFWMLRYSFKTKKYENKNLSTQLLVPYEKILDNTYVQTKNLKSGTKYFAVIKFKGKTPWSEEAEDAEAFLAKFINLLDSSNLHLSIIRNKELIDYTANFECLKSNIESKMNRLNDLGAPKSVKENFENLYHERYLDFDMLDKEILVDTYYIVLYQSRIHELNKSVDNAYTLLNSMELEPEVVKGINLIKFLARQNHLKVDQQKANEYLEKASDKNNWKTQLNLPINKKDWISRVKNWFFRHKTKGKELSIEVKELNLSSLLCSEKVIFKPSYFIKDGKYYSIQVLSELPLRLMNGWSYELLNNNSNIVWNMGVIGYDGIADLIDKSSRTTRDNNEVINSQFNKKGNNLQLEAIEHLEEQILVNDNNLFNFHLLIVNEASSLRELRNLENKNLSNAKRSKIKLKSLPFRQFEAFAQTMLIPTDNLNEAMQISSHNLAYGWSFENEYQNDGNLALLGTTLDTGEAIIVDRFYKKNNRRTNYNWFTLGSSGKGKSTSKSKSIVDALMENHNVYVIDLENEYNYLAKKFGGTIFNLGTSSTACLNPLEVRMQLWEKETNKEPQIGSIIKKHNEWLEGFFKLVKDDFSDVHIMIIMKAVKKLYDNIGVKECKHYTDLNNLKWPVMSDLISILKKWDYKDNYDRERKAFLIDGIIDTFEYLFENNGKYEKLYNAQTNINLNNDFIVFNTKELMSLGKEENNIATYVLLSLIQNLVYQNVILNPNKHTVLFIDEVHQYVDELKPLMLNFLWKLTKTGRKYLLSMDLTTQSPSDLLISKKAESIVQNCQYSTIFGLKNHDLGAVKKMYEYAGGLNSTTTSFLNDGIIGNSLVSLHLNSKIKIEAWYNNFEKNLYFKQGDFKRME